MAEYAISTSTAFRLQREVVVTHGCAVNEPKGASHARLLLTEIGHATPLLPQPHIEATGAKPRL